jgi:hypothetical protein
MSMPETLVITNVLEDKVLESMTLSLAAKASILPMSKARIQRQTNGIDEHKNKRFVIIR